MLGGGSLTTRNLTAGSVNPAAAAVNPAALGSEQATSAVSELLLLLPLLIHHVLPLYCLLQDPHEGGLLLPAAAAAAPADTPCTASVLAPCRTLRRLPSAARWPR
jgi:hypothetical protein